MKRTLDINLERRHKIPWTASSFRKHNRKATQAQLEAAAERANAVLTETKDEGLAVKLGNALIKKMREK